MRNVLVCVCIIIGTIIGAGFASGQEIISFFNRFGGAGFYRYINCLYSVWCCSNNHYESCK